MIDTDRPRIGVSACLLGKQVRYDGGHKKSVFLTGALQRFVDFVPVCPEVESGMTVPRESLRLIERSEGVRLIGNRSREDYTEQVERWARASVASLAALPLDGFVLKKDSPSCGLTRVRVFPGDGNLAPAREGTGLFAAQLRKGIPSLPLAEDGWLFDATLREAFLEQIFLHHRMRRTLLAAPSRAGLLEFHADHKLIYMAHSPVRYRELGRLAASVATRPLAETLSSYRENAIAALRERATPGKHANVLQHVMGYFKDVLSAGEKSELLGLIDEFRTGLHGLAVPLTLLVHHLRKHEIGGWLARQVYFQPYPRALSAPF